MCQHLLGDNISQRSLDGCQNSVCYLASGAINHATNALSKQDFCAYRVNQRWGAHAAKMACQQVICQEAGARAR